MAICRSRQNVYPFVPAPRHRALSQLRQRGTAELGSQPRMQTSPPGGHHIFRIGIPIISTFICHCCILHGVDSIFFHLEFRTCILMQGSPRHLFWLPSLNFIPFRAYFGFHFGGASTKLCVSGKCDVLSYHIANRQVRKQNCPLSWTLGVASWKIYFNLDHLQEGSAWKSRIVWNY